MNALKSLKMNKHPKQKKWESKWNSCTRQRLDKTGLKNAEPEIFTSVAEFLNSFLLFSSLHCVELEVSISRIDLKTIKVDITFFCHLCMCFLLLQSRISNHSLTTQANVKKLFSLDLSLAQKGRNQRSLILHAFFLRAQQKTLLWPFPIFGGNLFFENFVIWYDSFQTLSNVTWLFLSHRLGCRKNIAKCTTDPRVELSLPK